MDEKELNQLREHYDKSMALAEKWNLSPFPVDFHVCPADRIYEVASYGIPGHFSHWTYGRDFWIQKMQYDHGRSKIYELVVNQNPAQAFLLDVNSTLENMFVISHVIGHSDFFANNAYFTHTNRTVEHTTVATAERFRQYEIEHGRRVVEALIDDILSIKMHINPNLRIKKQPADYEISYLHDPYLDLFPEEQRQRQAAEFKDRAERAIRKMKPEEDVLLFLAQTAPYLDDWERDIIMAIRDEEYYFLPQYQTKIMNEGWASLIHRTMMHTIESDVDPGGIEFANMHSRVLNDSPGRVNPYWVGYNVFLRIIEKYGDHSPEDMRSLNFINSEGWQKALEVRELDNDESFLRNFLDRDLVERLDLFAFGYNQEDKQWEVTDSQDEWEDVRDAFVKTQTSLKTPVITAKKLPNGDLCLDHEWDGRPLQERYAQKTMEALYRIWGNRVILNTRDDDGKLKTMTVDANSIH